MVSVQPKVAAAAVLAASSIAAASAFTPSSRSELQCRPRHPQSPLFVQSKVGVFVTENDTTAMVAEDEEILLVAQDLTKTLEESIEAAPPAETAPEPVTREIQHVYTTAEEAAIFLADAPVTPDEGAYIAEEGVFTGDGLFWRGAVVVLCALWASNFACAKIILAQPGVDASLYAVARFSLAALSLLPGSINAARKGSISWDTAKGAFFCGSWVAFGYLGQSIGLLTTTPSRSCVICSLNCIFVAIVAELMRVNARKERGYSTDFDLKKMIPALIAVVGVAIIELKGAAGDPTIGDLISFSQPIGFGLGYLQLEKLMERQPSAALPVSAIKLAVVALASMFFFEASPHAAVDVAASVDTEAVVEAAKQSVGGFGLKIPDFTPILSSPVALGAIAYTGLVTTSLALWVESVAFQRVPATDASIILTTEPLFAAGISAALIGETFGPSDLVGALFIVGACLYAIRMGESKELCDDDTMECIVVDDTN